MASRKRKERPAIDPKVAKKLADDGWQAAPGGGTAETLQEGDTLIGVFQGFEDTRFTRDDGEPARVIVVDTDGGQVKAWAPTILQNRCETFNPGDEVRIECLGKIRTGSGRNAWDFDVRVKRHSDPRKPEPRQAPEVKGRKKPSSKKRGR